MKHGWLKPIRSVVKESRYVRINQAAIEKFVRSFEPKATEIDPATWPFTLMAFEKLEDEVQFWFLADAQAFCFWGYPDKWTIDYQGTRLDGWWALLAAQQRAIETGIPLLEAAHLKRLTLNQLREVYKGRPEIPLLNERLRILKAIGQVLDVRFGGKFIEYLRQGPTAAVVLALDIAKTFEGFNDVAKYRGQTVGFFKKAQLLVADLDNMRRLKPRLSISGMEHLTGEADYKIPALLRSLGILQYADALATKVDNRIELEPGSEMEVEIRATTLEVIARIVEKLKPRYPDLISSSLDRILWHMSQDKSLITKPYHLTTTIHY